MVGCLNTFSSLFNAPMTLWITRVRFGIRVTLELQLLYVDHLWSHEIQSGPSMQRFFPETLFFLSKPKETKVHFAA